MSDPLRQVLLYLMQRQAVMTQTRLCRSAQSSQSLSYSHTYSMDVDGGSDQMTGLQHDQVAMHICLIMISHKHDSYQNLVCWPI